MSQHLQVRYGVDLAVSLDAPAEARFGEFACAVAFPLARLLRKPPRAIALELIEDLGQLPGAASLEIAGGGFINIRLDRARYGAALLAPSEPSSAARAGKSVGMVVLRRRCAVLPADRTPRPSVRGIALAAPLRLPADAFLHAWQARAAPRPRG